MGTYPPGKISLGNQSWNQIGLKLQRGTWWESVDPEITLLVCDAWRVRCFLMRFWIFTISWNTRCFTKNGLLYTPGVSLKCSGMVSNPNSTGNIQMFINVLEMGVSTINVAGSLCIQQKLADDFLLVNSPFFPGKSPCFLVHPPILSWKIPNFVLENHHFSCADFW